MNITIEPQLPLVTIEYLTSPFLSSQQRRVNQIQAIIAAGKKRLEQWRQTNHVPDIPTLPGQMLTGDLITQRAALRSAWAQTEGAFARTVRKDVDAEVQPLLKQCRDAATEAKVRSERQFDKQSLLRRACLGLSRGDFWSQKLSLATILAKSGPVELSKWAQWAVDASDPMIADSVIRENNSRKTDDRGFTSANVLTELSLPDFDRAQALLTQVINLANDIGVTYSEFENDKSDSLGRIAIGLRKMRAGQLKNDGTVTALPAKPGEGN